MTEAIFLYGLFMDPAVRAARGLGPAPQRVAVLPDWRIMLAERANLAPSAGERVWGVVAWMEPAEVGVLYAGEAYAAYAPVAVEADVDGESLAAIAYITPPDSARPRDPAYAAALAELCRRLGFPAEYVALIGAGA